MKFEIQDRKFSMDGRSFSASYAVGCINSPEFRIVSLPVGYIPADKLAAIIEGREFTDEHAILLTEAVAEVMERCAKFLKR